MYHGRIDIFVHGPDAADILVDKPVQFRIFAAGHQMAHFSPFHQGQFPVNEIPQRVDENSVVCKSQLPHKPDHGGFTGVHGRSQLPGGHEHGLVRA
nr:hypothetical protein [Desulfotignum phosphitoxidans]